MANEPADPRAEKAVGWTIGALTSLAAVYFAWYLLPGPLWRWANDAWWHWGLAIPAFLLLLAAPIWMMVCARALVAATGVGASWRLWWARLGYVGTAGAMLLTLWALTPEPFWWVGWWLWGAAVVGVAIVGAAGWMLFSVHEVEGPPKARQSFAHEWRFNHGDKGSPPALGLAMSGGGIRSAAFNIGVLQALHQQQILRTVDVVSAVSGGSYAMSWYLMQPFYAARAAPDQHTDFVLDTLIDEMFHPDGRFQAHLSRDPSMVDYSSLVFGLAIDGTFFQPLRAVVATIGALGQYNGAGGVRAGYRERIQELFQGLPLPGPTSQIGNRVDPLLWQELNLDSSTFSCVTPVRYQELAAFAWQHGLPFFIFNGAVLVERPYRHLLWPTAFELTADDAGSDVCGYRRWDELKDWDVGEVPEAQTADGFWTGYRHLLARHRETRPNRWIFMVNLAPAISGAALGLSFFDPRRQSRRMRLATWMPFVGNLDLGYLFPRAIWNGTGALYASDGGHSENLGAYALIKRQCRRIIIVDAEHEKTVPYGFHGYRKLKERLEEENSLVLAVSAIDSYLEAAAGARASTGPPPAVMTGTVTPRESNSAAVSLAVIYVKLALDRARLESYPAEVRDYARTHAPFPQDPTSDQTFSTGQFVAYRELGRHVASGPDFEHALRAISALDGAMAQVSAATARPTSSKRDS